MRIFKGGHLLVGAALLVVAPLATVALAGSASAVSFPGATATCTKLVGTTQSGIADANLDFCTAGSTGGNGAIANFTLHSGDVTWANGTTTDYAGTATQSGRICHAPTTVEYKFAGSVTSSTNSSIPVGAAVKMKVCFEPSNDEVRNVTGTTIKF